MMQIIINNKVCDIDKNTKVNLTRQISDYNNPAEISTDFTKSITLPLTVNNNGIFGHLNSVSSNASNYNASKRYDAEIRYNGDVIIRGYCKLESVNNKGYKLNIYSDVAEFYRKLEDKKLTDIVEYIQTADQVELTHMLNRQMVYNSWYMENDVNGRRWTDYISYGMGYTGIYSDFNNKAAQITVDRRLPISMSDEEKEDLLFTEAPEDVDEHQMLIYSARHQRRGFYINKIIKSILESTGYKIEYSPLFFNNNNPYWKDTVLFSPTKDNEDKRGGEPLVFKFDTKSGVMDFNKTSWPDEFGKKYYYFLENVGFVNEPSTSKYLTAENFLDLKKVDKLFNKFKVKLNVRYRISEFDYPEAHGVIAATNNMFYNFIQNNVTGFAYRDATKKNKSQYAILPGLSWKGASGYDYYAPTLSGEQCNSIVNYDYELYYPEYYEYSDTFEYERAFTGFDAGNNGIVKLDAAFYDRVGKKTILNKACKLEYFIDGGELTLIDDANTDDKGEEVFMSPRLILSSEENQKDILLSYFKLFDIHVDIDKAKKTVKLLTRNEFYQNLTIENWGKLHDESKSSNITPIPFNTKYMSFKYKDSNSDIAEKYKSVYQRVYGEARIDTGYEFGDEELDVLNTIYTVPMICQDTAWEFKDRWKKGSNRDDKVMMYTCKKEGNVRSNVDDGLQIYFRNSLKNCTFYDISDPTWEMIKYDKECHNYTMYDKLGYEINVRPGVAKQVDGKTQYMYRQFSSIHDSGVSLDFRRPSEIYYEGGYPDGVGIYDLFWSNYIDDVYDVDNKVFNGYFKLSNEYINQFKFNTFIYFQNQYWRVNRIIDYDPTSDDSVNIELIQAKNPYSYPTSQLYPWIEDMASVNENVK